MEYQQITWSSELPLSYCCAPDANLLQSKKAYTSKHTFHSKKSLLQQLTDPLVQKQKCTVLVVLLPSSRHTFQSRYQRNTSSKFGLLESQRCSRMQSPRDHQHRISGCKNTQAAEATSSSNRKAYLPAQVPASDFIKVRLTREPVLQHVVPGREEAEFQQVDHVVLRQHSLPGHEPLEGGQVLLIWVDHQHIL